LVRSVGVILVNNSWIQSLLESVKPGFDPREPIYVATLLAEPKEVSPGGAPLILAFSCCDSVYINTDLVNLSDSAFYSILAHELTHLLQGMNFNISAPTTLDESLAYQTLIEGDAGFTAKLFCTNTELCEPSKRIELPPNDPRMALALFPYAYGEAFVEALYEVGGWSLVNRAYGKPPPGARYVMWVEDYLAYLNGSAPIEEPRLEVGCSGGVEVHRDRLGSFYVYLLFSRIEGGSPGLAGRLVSDSIVLCNASNGYGVVWRTMWADGEAAAEFFRLYTELYRSLNGSCIALDTEARCVLRAAWGLVEADIEVQRGVNEVLYKALYTPRPVPSLGGPNTVTVTVTVRALNTPMTVSVAVLLLLLGLAAGRIARRRSAGERES